MRIVIFLSTLLMLFACSDKHIEQNQEENQIARFNIDSNRITTSGLSSGGYMAGQLHLAHSNLIGGVAILAGGPYWCAEASLTKGLGPCVKGGDVAQERLLQYASAMADANELDSLKNLADDSIWLFHGANDTAVDKSVVTQAAYFYKALAPNAQVTVVTDVSATHGMPTLSTGAPCDTMATPFLIACQYDAAGELLKALYGSMQERVTASGELGMISQPGASDAEMLDSAYLYVPSSCASGAPCGLHIAFHGCQQSSEFVDDAFAAGAGYNEWAESNNLLVLYPQVASSKFAPMNPLGCWDWWGYTNEHYATKSGPQIAVVEAMISRLGNER